MAASFKSSRDPASASTACRLFNRLAFLAAGIVLCQAASAASVIWSGGGSPDLRWATPANWSPASSPGAGDTVSFFDAGTASTTGGSDVNNVVPASLTVAALTFGQTNGFHNTQINPGATLTVSNAISGATVFTGTGTDAGASQQVTAAIVGAGAAFVVINTNTGSLFNVRQGSTTSGTHRATLDLSALDTFSLTAGRLLVGGDGTSTAANNRPGGTLYLAKTNTLRLNGASPACNVGDGSSNGGTEYVYLGQTNALFADSMTIARQKCTATLTFNTIYAGSSPVLFLRGNSSSRMATLAIGDNSAQSTSGTSDNGTVDLGAGSVDAQVDVCYVGRGLNGTGTGTATGTLTLGGGLFDVNTLEAGYVNINTAVATVNGTITVNAPATLQVNNFLRLGRNPGATATANGTLNIIGGTVRANAITNSTGTANSTITISGGTLALTNTAGTAASPLTMLNVSDSVLRLSVANGVTNIVVTTLTVGSTTNNTITISALPVITAYPAQYPLIAYSSASGFDFVLGSLPEASTPFVGYLSNNTANATIDLVIASGPMTSRSLTWRGNVSSDWDTTTANWVFSSAPTTYNQNDQVTFDDSATGSTTINLNTSFTPFGLTIDNSAKAYTFTGTGGLSGATGLTKQGTGMFTLGNTGLNNFTGPVAINGGTLRLSGGTDRLPTTATVFLTDSPTAALDLNSQNQTLASLSGGGATGGNLALGSGILALSSGGTFAGVISGSGLLIKTNPAATAGGNLILAGPNTYSGGTIIGGSTNTTTLSVSNQTGSGTGSGFVAVLTNGILSLGAGGTGGSVAAAIITNSGIIRFDRTDDFTLSNVILGPGNVDKRNTGTVIVSGTNGYTGLTTITAGALVISNAAALGAATSSLTIQNDPTARLVLNGGLLLTKPLIVANKQSAAGAVPAVVNQSGTNTLAGPITGNAGGSYWTFQVDADQLIVSGTFTNNNTSNTRSIRLRGAAGLGDWRGNIGDAASGLSLTGILKEDEGTWILSGTNTCTGGITISGGTLLVNGIIAGGTIIANAGALGGTGAILVPVTVGASGTLAPGETIGTLTISNSLTLNGTTAMQVSHSAADKVIGLDSLTLGGTLQVAVVGDLTGGEVFKLFAATNYSGDFAAYDLPPLPSPLAWDPSQIPLNGTLRVTGGAAPQPTIGSVSISGSSLVVPVPSYAGYSYVLQSTTSLTPPIQWVNQATNAGTGDTLLFTLPLDSATPKTFVRFWVY